MNVAKPCLLIPEAHSRNFHQICQNESEHNSNSYDLFLTNAVSDGIKLWDLRTAQYEKLLLSFKLLFNQFLFTILN